MSSSTRRKRDSMRVKIKSVGDHKEFLKRINKTLYYGQLPSLPCLSLPVTEVSCEAWSMCQRGRSLRRLRAEEAARLTRGACVSPCTLVLALLYLERLHACNPDYLNDTEPSDLFLVSLMVGSKFLEDSGEDDEVLCSEWAESSGLQLDHLKRLEIEFLKAIDWKVYVGKDSFEEGLCWLEKRVALREGGRRGFYTYTELAAAGEGVLGAGTLGALAAACLALALAYLTGLLSLQASALLLSQATRTSLPTTHIITSNPLRPAQPNNDTSLDAPKSELVLDGPDGSERIECCTRWSKFQDGVEMPRVNRPDRRMTNDSLWWRTSALSWLYQSSIVDPVQRWLEKLNFIAEFLNSEMKLANDIPKQNKFNNLANEKTKSPEHCIKQWLNLSKLSALTGSVSDR